MLGNLLDLAVIAPPLLRRGSTSLVSFVASLAVLDAERGVKDATITTLGGCHLWAMKTVTTVRYGDRYRSRRRCGSSRVGSMFAGVALLGVTALLASWLLDKVREVWELTQAATRADMAALTFESGALRQGAPNARKRPTRSQLRLSSTARATTQLAKRPSGRS